MNKQFYRKLSPRGLIAAAAIGIMSALPAAAQQTARLSYHWGPQHPSAVFANRFAELVGERSGGELTIQVFPSGQLFGIRDVLGGVSSGAVEIGAAVGVVSFPPLDRNYNVTNLPGVFASYDQIRGFFDETEAGRAVMDNIRSAAGIEIIGFNPVGPSALFTTRENINGIEDFEGVSARVLANAERPRWEALGAGRMVSLPTGEVYTALQNGMIDTVATVPGAIKAYSWWDFLTTAQLPYFQFNDAYFIANKAWLDSLTPELRLIVLDVAAEISAESTAAIMAESDNVLEEFAARGGTVVTFEGEALEELSAMERNEVLPAMLGEVDQEVVDAALAYTGNN